MTALLAWLDTYQTELATLGTVSVIMLVVTLLATPYLVSLLPTNYFRSTERHPVLPGWTGVAWSIARNIAGAVFMVLGIAMLVLPGPGVVCFIIGLSLCEFPGKQRFLRALINSNPGILTSINWLREKSGKEPLLPPNDSP